MTGPHAPNAASAAALKRAFALAALAVSLSLIGAGTALAQSGGTQPPGSTTPAPAPTPAPATGFTFPIPAAYPHTFGDGFGVARTGHAHQGQDIMAACGAPLVAVTYGRVVARKFHRAAGNYLVIRSKKARQDYVYAHMAAPALVGKRIKLTPGMAVGNVGLTGNASTCHLHFEIWRFPGWYLRGGKPINPLAQLQYWDSYS